MIATAAELDQLRTLPTPRSLTSTTEAVEVCRVRSEMQALGFAPREIAEEESRVRHLFAIHTRTVELMEGQS